MPARDDDLRVKRVYDPPDPADGYRVLVDRLWPRGVSTEHAALDLWLAAVAPSRDLRTRWHHDPERTDEFAAEYRRELDGNPAVADLRELLQSHPVVTLLYASRDRSSNHALVLRRYLQAGSGAAAASEGARDGDDDRFVRPTALAGLSAVSQPAGDAACWLASVCPACGAFNEAPPQPCWNCGRTPDDAPAPPRPAGSG